MLPAAAAAFRVPPGCKPSHRLCTLGWVVRDRRIALAPAPMRVQVAAVCLRAPHVLVCAAGCFRIGMRRVQLLRRLQGLSSPFSLFCLSSPAVRTMHKAPAILYRWRNSIGPFPYPDVLQLRSAAKRLLMLTCAPGQQRSAFRRRAGLGRGSPPHARVTLLRNCARCVGRAFFAHAVAALLGARRTLPDCCRRSVGLGSSRHGTGGL